MALSASTFALHTSTIRKIISLLCSELSNERPHVTQNKIQSPYNGLRGPTDVSIIGLHPNPSWPYAIFSFSTLLLQVTLASSLFLSHPYRLPFKFLCQEYFLHIFRLGSFPLPSSLCSNNTFSVRSAICISLKIEVSILIIFAYLFLKYWKPSNMLYHLLIYYIYCVSSLLKM